MGETKRIVKEELKRALYENMMMELNDDISRLNSTNKKMLREYVEHLSTDATIHSYSNIFIGRKVQDLLKNQTNGS